MEPKLVEVPENFISDIAKIYQRTEDSLNEDVEKLKRWMESQPHFPEVLDKKILQNFLIFNKCSTEKAKEKIYNYYAIRTKIDLFQNSNPANPNTQKALDTIYWVLLPKLTPQNYRVWFFKMRNKELIENISPLDVLPICFSFEEIRLREDVMFGDIWVYDMEGFPFSYLSKLTPTLLAKVFAAYEKVYSLPLKGMYLLNANSLLNSILAVVKSLIKPKMAQRIRVCEDTSLLQECLPQGLIPKEYGGGGQSLEELRELTKFKFNQYKDLFDRLETLRVDESLKPEKLHDDEFLGFHGNFKKLSVD